MRNKLLLAACSLVFTACAPATRYRVGDFVVYRYQGLAIGEPVTLREEVVAQQGNRLRFDITATRGSTTRSWIQVITDTFENQRDNKVDALYEVADGKATRLKNEANRDLLRLYEWTLFAPDVASSGVSKARCQKEIAGQHCECICTSGQSGYQRAIVLFEESVCPEFLWTHGPSRFADAATGDDVLKVEVIEAAHRQGAQPQPMEP